MNVPAGLKTHVHELSPDRTAWIFNVDVTVLCHLKHAVTLWGRLPPPYASRHLMSVIVDVKQYADIGHLRTNVNAQDGIFILFHPFFSPPFLSKILFGLLQVNNSGFEFRFIYRQVHSYHELQIWLWLQIQTKRGKIKMCARRRVSELKKMSPGCSDSVTIISTGEKSKISCSLWWDVSKSWLWSFCRRLDHCISIISGVVHGSGA